MPSVSRYRTWLAVPADEIEDLKKSTSPDERAHARPLG